MLERICRWDGVCFNQGDIRRRIDYPCWPHCGRATSSIETGLEQRRMSIHVDTHVYTQIHRLQGLSIVRSGGEKGGGVECLDPLWRTLETIFAAIIED